MSSATLPCSPNLPSLLLVEPLNEQSVRAAQLNKYQYCVTQTDCALDIFLMRDMFRFSIAILSDQVGTLFLCSAAENVRWQWPLARILILGQVPAAMSDQLYDDVAGHSLDEIMLLYTLDRLAEDPWRQRSEPVPTHLLGACEQMGAVRAPALRESDPTKLPKAAPRGLYERDLPSDQHRAYRRGHYAFPPPSKLKSLAFLGVAACSLCSPLPGQHLVRDLSGTVTDGHHEPLRGAIVQVQCEGIGTVVSYITDRSGRYSFKRLEGDLDYTVWATWNGKRSSIKKLSLFDSSTNKVLDLEVRPDAKPTI